MAFMDDPDNRALTRTAHRDSVAQLKRQILDAWTDGCNCCLCLTMEGLMQGHLNERQYHDLLDEVITLLPSWSEHGDGRFCNPPTRLCRELRKKLGWPVVGQLALKLGSESGRRRHPTCPPH